MLGKALVSYSKDPTKIEREKALTLKGKGDKIQFAEFWFERSPSKGFWKKEEGKRSLDLGNYKITQLITFQ